MSPGSQCQSDGVVILRVTAFFVGPYLSLEGVWHGERAGDPTECIDDVCRYSGKRANGGNYRGLLREERNAAAAAASFLLVFLYIAKKER